MARLRGSYVANDFDGGEDEPSEAGRAAHADGGWSAFRACTAVRENPDDLT